MTAAARNLRNVEGAVDNGGAKEQVWENSKRITLDMTDSERYEILKSRTIDNVPSVTDERIEKTSINSWDDINQALGKQKRQLIKKLASEFGVFKGYENSDVDLEFAFSNNNFEESYSKQKHNYVDFSKMLSVFDDVVSNSVGIEVHNRNKKGYKLDPTLEAVYVLVSAFKDGEYIIPVKLEVKEFKDKANVLYVAIALEKVKATEVSGQGNTENSVTQNSRSVASITINIAQLFRNINPKDEPFIKYIPKQFFEDSAKYQSRDSTDMIAYKYAIKNGDMEIAQRLVDRTANRVFSESKVRDKEGKLRKVYHYTNTDFFSFDTDRSGKNQGQTHGDGIYISTSPDEFSYAGKKRMTLYANITNPFEMLLSEDQARYVLERYAVTKHNLDKYDGLYRNHAMSALQSSIKVFDYLKEYADDNNIKVSDILKDLGYDGVHDGSEWVAFSSGQLKSADPVTYDDNSNVIPLSQRFDTVSSRRYAVPRTVFFTPFQILSLSYLNQQKG